MDELSRTKEYHGHLEIALQNSKETTLNGHILPGLNGQEIQHSSEINTGPTCQLCGKVLSVSHTEIDQKHSKSTSCVLCSHIENLDSTVSEEDQDQHNKRDSGFHTLRRDDSKKMEADTTESMSSADSAMSVNFKSPITPNIRELPSIVVNSAPEDNEPEHVSNCDISVGKSSVAVSGTGFKETPQSLAEKLFYFKGYKRTEVAKHLGKNNDFSKQVGEAYMKHFNFTNVSLIDAYRDFLGRFALLGETQERERVLFYFSQRYITCNPGFGDSNSDTIHTLICALTLLNTDLHSNMSFNTGRKKMTSKQFLANLSGMVPEEYSKELLISLYNSVKKMPLPWGGKEQRKLPPRSSSMRQEGDTFEGGRSPTKIVNRSMSVRTTTKSGKHTSSGSSSKGGLGRSAKHKSLTSNQGLLWRKVLLDSDGKKVSLGKRGWKIYSVALQNLELHIVKRGTSEAKCISLHHSLAEETRTDSKREHVFRLTLADTSVTLYQASSDKDTTRWVKDINKAAALYSAAPLCSPVGSQHVYRRPLLPSAPSTLPVINQFKKLNQLLIENKEDLEAAEKCPSKRDMSPQEMHYEEEQITHLKWEIKKYKQYTKILRDILRTNSEKKADSESRDSEDPRCSPDNGSLVSVTPSEPPLASPSPFTHTESFIYPEPGDETQTPCNNSNVFSSPAHLVSPQHRLLTLSPTSSLPNLSPILEGAALPQTDHPSDDPAHGSLKRKQRKERNMYESSLNDTPHFQLELEGEDPNFEIGNTNNSNRLISTSSITGKTPPYPGYRLHRNRVVHYSLANGSVGTGAHGLPGISRDEDSRRISPNGVAKTAAISSSIHSPAGLSGAFPVKRYEMRITDLNPNNTGRGRILLEKQNAHANGIGFSTKEEAMPVSGQNDFKTPVGHAMLDKLTPSTQDQSTVTVGRVRGRRERKGTERFSYMLAVSPRGEQ